MLNVAQALMKAIQQLADKAILLVLLKSLGVTMAIFVVLGVGFYFALAWALGYFGMESAGDGTALTSVILTLLAAWLLFRVVAIGVMQFFADDVVEAVEQAHYDQIGRRLPFAEDFRNSVRGMGKALAINLLALPIAIILLFTAIGPGIIFIAANAVNLGRELTDMCWLRHCPSSGDGQKENPVTAAERTLLGASIAGLMLLPIANLLAPIIGAAAGTHLVHARRTGMKEN